MIRPHCGFALLLIGMGILAYSNSFLVPFIFDDIHAIVENPHLRRLWPPGEWLSAPAQSSVAGRPLVSLSLTLNYALSGQRVWSYHVLNLALHLGSGLLFFGLLRRTFLRASLRQRWGEQAESWAATAALLWSVHPLLTEAVTYVVQRTELLMGFFLLLTLYCFVRSWESSWALSWQVAAVLACALGMGSKEVMVVAPLLVWVYDWVFVGDSGKELWGRRGRLYLGLAGTWLILAVLISRGPRSESVGFGLGIGAWEYLQTQSTVLLHYLRLAVWPHPLCIDYHDWPLARGVVEVGPQMTLMGLLVGMSVWGVVKRRWTGFLGAWFFLILAPSSSVVPIVTEVAAERRMYLSLMAVVVLGVVGVSRLLSLAGERWPGVQRRRGGISRMLVGIVGVVFVSLTFMRNEDYRTELSIWSDAVAKRPQNARARYSLGHALARGGETQLAQHHLMEAIRLDPPYPDAQTALGLLKLRQGNTEAAIEHFSLALRFKPTSHQAVCNLGLARAQQGRLDEAIGHFQEALRLKPDFAEALYNLARAYEQAGRSREAIETYQSLLRLYPDDAAARARLLMLQRPSAGAQGF